MKKLKHLAKDDRKKRGLCLKFDEADFLLLKKKADMYAGGNVSAWVRYATLTLDPRPEDLILDPSQSL